MENLLANAAKYTNEGGQVWLTLQEQGDEAVLSVRDCGIGIAPEVLPHIFDLFTQAEQSLDSLPRWTGHRTDARATTGRDARGKG